MGSSAAAYDAIAEHYDAGVEGDRWMRDILWNAYSRRFEPGMRVLDVSCGTGIDALFLARRGVHVTAIDNSVGMIERLRFKASTNDHERLIESTVLDASQLLTLRPRSFDGLISAFAGLNTLPSLDDFAGQAWAMVRPGGHCVVHLLNRFSLWEFAGHVAGGRWSRARGLRRDDRRTFEIGGHPVEHRLLDPLESASVFRSAGFEIDAVYGLGILRPPHNLTRVPRRAVVALERIETVVRSHRPFVGWGRFFVLEMRRPVDSR